MALPNRIPAASCCCGQPSRSPERLCSARGFCHCSEAGERSVESGRLMADFAAFLLVALVKPPKCPSLSFPCMPHLPWPWGRLRYPRPGSQGAESWLVTQGQVSGDCHPCSSLYPPAPWEPSCPDISPPPLPLSRQPSQTHALPTIDLILMLTG